MEFEGLKAPGESPVIHNLGTDDPRRWPLLRTGEREPIAPACRRLVLDRDNYRCTVCNADYRLNLDHIVPWSAGGADTSDNLRVLCEMHNVDRSNFREMYLPRIVPVVAVCDPCLLVHNSDDRPWHLQRHFWACEYAIGAKNCPLCRHGEFEVYTERHPAYCGTCTVTSWVSDPGRLL